MAVLAVIGRKRLRGEVPVRGSAERDLVCGAEPVPGTHDRFPLLSEITCGSRSVLDWKISPHKAGVISDNARLSLIMLNGASEVAPTMSPLSLLLTAPG